MNDGTNPNSLKNLKKRTKGDPAPPTGYVRVDIARMLLAALAPFADVAHEEAVEAVRIAKEVGL